jgi:Domain of unknown function (DUF927)
MIFAFCLAFVGPLSAVTTVEHVGMQFVSLLGGEGKSGIGVVSSSAWGWDPDANVADRNGFGQNWNSTINALEQTLCGYNQTFLFLNESNLADANGAKQSANILGAIFKRRILSSLRSPVNIPENFLGRREWRLYQSRSNWRSTTSCRQFKTSFLLLRSGV